MAAATTSIASSVLSTATSASASASATPSSCSTADFTRFPTSDIACAVGSTQGIASNTSSVLESCCKSAPVESFNGACGWYCLSVEQTVAELQACFMEGGVSPSNVFCNGNNSATATGKPSKTSSASGGAASGTNTAGGAEGTKTPSGAVTQVKGVGKAGLGVLAVVFVSAFAGAVL